MENSDAEQNRAHIHDHLTVVRFLAQTRDNPMLVYLIEMALVENQGGEIAELTETDLTFGGSVRHMFELDS